ncbi:MAG: BREX-1 system phosphatase PglZ type A, partial [Cytophagia bacterium]|nr:BREX-1 system phosphatase PglZ type A [Cytophagia bacterium]
MNEFRAALLKKFQDHRVVFWYDEKNELREQFDELDISGIEKIHVTGNEFQVKYQVNVTNPKTQHLLYFSAPKPANEENWLLDMELMHTIFHTDQESMILQEIGLEQYFKELVANHIEYFKSKWRISKLRALIKKDDDYREIKEKMLAVTFGSEHIGWASFIHAHALAFTNANDKVDQELVRFNLHEYYWQEIKTRYQYQSESPAIYDFLIDVFSKILRVENRLEKTSDSQLLISLWKDSLKYRDSFAKISDKIAYDLDIESTLEGKSLLHLENDDLFQLSDMKIIQLLTDGIINRELSHEKVIGFTKLRHNKFWYSEFKHFYESIDYASEIISLIQKYENLKFESWDSGVKEYSDNLFQIDLLYRKFIWSYQKTNQNMILFDVSEKAEKMYSNDWLLNVNNNWQVIVDKLELWPSKGYHAQSKLFDNHIKSYIDQKLRLFIIISDGLRFECGYELSKMLHAENRYDANIDYMVTGIPSYTQMGMASMLPHKQMTLKENSELILLDGQTSSGI